MNVSPTPGQKFVQFVHHQFIDADGLPSTKIQKKFKNRSESVASCPLQSPQISRSKRAGEALLRRSTGGFARGVNATQNQTSTSFTQGVVARNPGVHTTGSSTPPVPRPSRE
jgi:hypothetical protein